MGKKILLLLVGKHEFIRKRKRGETIECKLHGFSHPETLHCVHRPKERERSTNGYGLVFEVCSHMAQHTKTLEHQKLGISGAATLSQVLYINILSISLDMDPLEM